MKPAVELNELMERIRQAANRQNGLAGGIAREYTADSELPPVPESMPVPPSPISSLTGDTTRPEALLDQAASMLRGGREKTTVPKGIPKMLRPLFRNQGGYNSVVLEAVERLIEVNRNLRQQNYDLHERVMDFHAWAHSVAEVSAENREWSLAANARLQPLTEERLTQLTDRISRLEKPGAPEEKPTPQSQGNSSPSAVAAKGSEPLDQQLARLTTHVEAIEADRRALNDHLNRLRAQIAEQAAYIQTVHRHLDQLGAHVDAALNRQDRPA